MNSASDFRCQLCSSASTISLQNRAAINSRNTKLFWNYLYHKNVRESISCGVGAEDTAHLAKFTFSLSLGNDEATSAHSQEDHIELCNECCKELEMLQELHQLLESTRRTIKCHVRKIEDRVNSEVRENENYDVLKLCSVPNFQVSMGGSVVGKENIWNSLEFIGKLCDGMSRPLPNSGRTSKLRPVQIVDQVDKKTQEPNHTELIHPQENSFHPAPETISDEIICDTTDITVIRKSLKRDSESTSAALSTGKANISRDFPDGSLMEPESNESRESSKNLPRAATEAHSDVAGVIIGTGDASVVHHGNANEILNHTRSINTGDSEDYMDETVNEIVTEPYVHKYDDAHTKEKAAQLNSIPPNSNTSLEADSELIDTHNNEVAELPNDPSEFELFFPPTETTISTVGGIAGFNRQQSQSMTAPGNEPIGSIQSHNANANPSGTSNMPLPRKRLRRAKLTFLCHVCGRLLHGESWICRHMAFHRNDRAFPCTFCGRRYITQSDLYRHRLIHTAEIKCCFCRKRFNQRSELENHAILCSSERPYPCNYCNRRFKYERGLRTHKINAHAVRGKPELHAKH